MESYERLSTLIEFIKNDHTVSVLNMFLKVDNYNERFMKIINILSETKKFDDLRETLFANLTKQEVDLFHSVKTLDVLLNKKNFIFINPIVYQDKIFDKDISNDDIMNVRIISSNDLTEKLIKFIRFDDNIFSKHIKNINKKSIIPKSLYRKYLAGNVDKEFESSLNILNKKEFFNKTEYMLKENEEYKLYKKRTIEILVHDEQLVSKIRITKPNSISLCLEDASHIYLNKIIVSKKLKIGNITFKTIKEKI